MAAARERGVAAEATEEEAEEEAEEESDEEVEEEAGKANKEAEEVEKKAAVEVAVVGGCFGPSGAVSAAEARARSPGQAEASAEARRALGHPEPSKRDTNPGRKALLLAAAASMAPVVAAVAAAAAVAVVAVAIVARLRRRRDASAATHGQRRTSPTSTGDASAQRVAAPSASAQLSSLNQHSFCPSSSALVRGPSQDANSGRAHTCSRATAERIAAALRAAAIAASSQPSPEPLHTVSHACVIVSHPPMRAHAMPA